jgi:hypothetical protein
MSPLTRSFFWMWALYDLRIGKSTDTLAYCQIAANDVILMNPHQLDACKKLETSRMGIYEHVGREGPHIRLRELITNNLLICHSPAGYLGKEGELWYVRLAPPLEPELAMYWIAMTTPYVLIEASKSDWLVFLKRAMVQFDWGSSDSGGFSRKPDELTRRTMGHSATFSLILTLTLIGATAVQAQRTQRQQGDDSRRGRFTFEQFSQRHDTNLDGRVESDEFKGAPQFFRWLDKNNDGAVTAEEFQKGTQRDRRQQPGRSGRIPDGVQVLKDLEYATVDGKLLLGLSADVQELEGDLGGNLEQSSRVDAIVDMFGPSALWPQCPGIVR